MTRNFASSHGSADRAAIEAAIRRAHILRSRFMAGLVKRAVRAIAGWIRVKAPERQLEHLSDHMLKDIGIHRDQLSGLVSAALMRDELSLSPAGSPSSSPAFWRGRARPAESANENYKTPRAA